MAYTSMSKLIKNKNLLFKNGKVNEVEYETWKTQTMEKLDLFLTCDRLTSEQYTELKDLLIEV